MEFLAYVVPRLSRGLSPCTNDFRFWTRFLRKIVYFRVIIA